jgi:hypothetical protein
MVYEQQTTTTTLIKKAKYKLKYLTREEKKIYKRGF